MAKARARRLLILVPFALAWAAVVLIPGDADVPPGGRDVVADVRTAAAAPARTVAVAAREGTEREAEVAPPRDEPAVSFRRARHDPIGHDIAPALADWLRARDESQGLLLERARAGVLSAGEIAAFNECSNALLDELTTLCRPPLEPLLATHALYRIDEHSGALLRILGPDRVRTLRTELDR